MIIFPSCSHISTTVWLHHLEYSNEKIGKKALWKIHKNIMCCLEQILEAARYKTALVRPLTSHLTNHRNKMCKIWRALLVKKEQTYNKMLFYWQTSDVWLEIIYIHLLCADTECHLEDLPRVVTNRDHWCERAKRICVISMTWWWWWWWWWYEVHVYICIQVCICITDSSSS